MLRDTLLEKINKAIFAVTKHGTMANKTNSDSMSGQAALISGKYLEMRSAVFAYILKRTGSVEDSEDLMQETFTRLLEYRTVLTGHTLDRFIYRTAHNLVVDWYRRHALSEKAQEYFASRQKSADTTEEDIRLKEMMRTEQVCVRKMGRRKGEIYLMYIHRGKTSGEISEMLGLSRRTVENHIFAARNIVRNEFREAL